MIERTHILIRRLEAMGFTYAEANQLRRIERTLQRWSELECGTGDDRVSLSVVRDDNGEGKPFLRRQWMGLNNQWQDIRTPYPDKEKGALARLAKIMAAHPGLVSYHQSDPRGCALYILKASDIKKGEDINAVYTRGVAVCA